MLLISEIVKRMQIELGDEKGQGLVEYALILVLISIAAVAIMTTLGTTISSVFTTIEGKL